MAREHCPDRWLHSPGRAWRWPRRQKRNNGAWHLARHTDRHVLGLFPRATRDEALCSFPGEMQMVKVPDLYDAFILGDNEYLLRVFVGTRR